MLIYGCSPHFLLICSNDWIVLGGTAQMGNFSLDISDEDREHIIRETRLIQPDLEVANCLCISFIKKTEGLFI